MSRPKGPVHAEPLKDLSFVVGFQPQAEDMHVSGDGEVSVTRDFTITSMHATPREVVRGIKPEDLRLRMTFETKRYSPYVAEVSVSETSLDIWLRLPLHAYEHVMRHDSLCLVMPAYMPRYNRYTWWGWLRKPLPRKLTLSQLRAEDYDAVYPSVSFSKQNESRRWFTGTHAPRKSANILPFLRPKQTT